MIEADKENKSLIYTIIAWAYPVAYGCHIIEEYFIGKGFPSWLSGEFGADLSNKEFIWMNAIAMAVVISVALFMTLRKASPFILSALGWLFFLNAIMHVVFSIATLTYSPGTITGLVFYLPLGIFVFRHVFRHMDETGKAGSIIAGTLVMAGIAAIAFII